MPLPDGRPGVRPVAPRVARRVRRQLCAGASGPALAGRRGSARWVRGVLLSVAAFGLGTGGGGGRSRGSYRVRSASCTDFARRISPLTCPAATPAGPPERRRTTTARPQPPFPAPTEHPRFEAAGGSPPARRRTARRAPPGLPAPWGPRRPAGGHPVAVPRERGRPAP